MTIRIRLPGGTLKIKTFQELRKHEATQQVPVRKIAGYYFIWDKARSGKTKRSEGSSGRHHRHRTSEETVVAAPSDPPAEQLDPVALEAAKAAFWSSGALSAHETAEGKIDDARIERAIRAYLKVRGDRHRAGHA